MNIVDTATQKRVRITLFVSILLLIVSFVVSVATGFVSLSPFQLARTIVGLGDNQENLILFDFRLPRILVTILAGMGLAVSGAILQSITKNPLSDPGILGINSGAGLMVVLYVAYFSIESTSFIYILPLIALIGGILSMVVIYFLSYKRGEGVDPTRLILVGVGMAAAFNGFIFTITARLEEEQNAFIANWIAGRIWGDDWTFVLALLPWILILVPIVFSKSPILNILNLNEHVSLGLGANVERERRILLLIAIALATASVSVSGGIAFIGLMAPHIARNLVGPRHQAFLPIAAVMGSILLLVSDTIGRSILDPSGIPAGIIVTIIGAPYFLYLMAKR
ncbi:FecCD family ABC transporter permease [Shimazuella kribbensis]|uniref:FecCD family ABC transporter permease n=1 Tax=Shimazuella kribbensis TaxID=139808 RepID=UPI00041561E7|nr:iron ABC transporter permease [Shimazuella kribbensis]